jgi:hypothetical protein
MEPTEDRICIARRSEARHWVQVEMIMTMIHGEGSRVTDLPAGIARESRDLHAVSSATRAGSGALAVVPEVGPLAVTGAARELDGEALAHEVGSIFVARLY